MAMMRTTRRAIGMSMREIAIRLPRNRLAELAAEWFKDMALSGVFWLTALTLLAALLLGGGTRGGFLSDALLQLLAIPLLLLSVARLSDLFWRDRDTLWQLRWELGFCLAAVLVPLVQLVPLPPVLWALLPHRAPLIASFDGLGRGLPWLPISVSPNATWLSVAADARRVLRHDLARLSRTPPVESRGRRLRHRQFVSRPPADRARPRQPAPLFCRDQRDGGRRLLRQSKSFCRVPVCRLAVGGGVGDRYRVCRRPLARSQDFRSPLDRDRHSELPRHRRSARGRSHGAFARRHDADHGQPGRRLLSGPGGPEAAHFQRHAFEFPARGGRNGLYPDFAIRALSRIGPLQCRPARRGPTAICPHHDRGGMGLHAVRRRTGNVRPGLWHVREAAGPVRARLHQSCPRRHPGALARNRDLRCCLDGCVRRLVRCPRGKNLAAWVCGGE